MLSLTTRTFEPDVTVIEIGGRIVLGTSGQIESAVLKALDDGAPKIVIDLSAVTSIDNLGIGIMTYCFNKISQQNGWLAISGAHGLVLNVFRITQIDTMIPFYPDLASACLAFTAGGSHSQVAVAGKMGQ